MSTHFCIGPWECGFLRTFDLPGCRSLQDLTSIADLPAWELEIILTPISVQADSNPLETARNLKMAR
jgi:hypothetical protein